MAADTKSSVDKSVLRLHAEDISVAKRRVDGETVRVGTVTRTREQPVDEELTHERVEVERIPIGRYVETAPAVRQEGDTTVLPVLEEVVVVERRLLLKEEVRITRVRVTERHRETVTLREQETVVSRAPSAQPSRLLESSNTSTEQKEPVP